MTLNRKYFCCSNVSQTLLKPRTWNRGHYTLGYRHRSNRMSQTHSSFVKNNHHNLPRLLSLLTTVYVKVDFFRRLTFRSFSGYRQRSQILLDLAEIFSTCSLDTRELKSRVWRKSNRKHISLVSVPCPLCIYWCYKHSLAKIQIINNMTSREKFFMLVASIFYFKTLKINNGNNYKKASV